MFLKFAKALLVGSVFASAALLEDAHASYLYNGYLEPSFYGAPDTQYSAWNYTSSGGYFPFYSANGGANNPTSAAPYGPYESASDAGVIDVGGNWDFVDPSAFWDSRNATITQSGSESFIAGSGGIYSNLGPTSFVLENATPYELGTVVFQFQTNGTLVDFSSIKLVYEDELGVEQTLSADEILKEFTGSTSTYGGLGNRTALQWNLTGLGITSYKILWDSEESSMSFVQALLDTAAEYETVVPASGRWIGSTGNWSDSGNWSQNTANGNYLPDNFGNALFENTGVANVNLDGDRAVGEIFFENASNVNISSTSGSKLIVNTGVSTSADAVGLYTISADYEFNALNFFNIEAGEVRLEGVVSGAYGFAKDGAGTLTLTNNNTFTGGVSIWDGTLRIEGTNAYTAPTTILFGELIVAADAGVTGALGNSSSAIVLGASSAVFQNPDNKTAALTIEGDHQISRNVNLAVGTFQKILGAQETVAGATFSGTINLGTSSDVVLRTAAVTDRVSFTGAITAGVATTGTVKIDGPGTVIYSGAAKTYLSNTVVSAGTLVLQTAFTGDGDFNVASGGTLNVSSGGNLSRSNATARLTIESGGRLTGGGQVSRDVFTTGAQSVIETHAADGVLTILSLDASAGAKFVFELSGTPSAALLNVGGLLTGATADGGLGVEFSNLNDIQVGQAYTLLSFGSSSGLTAGDFALLNPELQLDVTFGVGGWRIEDGVVQVQFAAVPEPSTYILIMLALAGLVFRYRFARKS